MQLATLGLRENFFSYLRLRNMLRVVADSEDVGKADVAVLQWFGRSVVRWVRSVSVQVGRSSVLGLRRELQCNGPKLAYRWCTLAFF